MRWRCSTSCAASIRARKTDRRRQSTVSADAAGSDRPGGVRACADRGCRCCECGVSRNRSLGTGRRRGGADGRRPAAGAGACGRCGRNRLRAVGSGRADRLRWRGYRAGWTRVPRGARPSWRRRHHRRGCRRQPSRCHVGGRAGGRVRCPGSGSRPDWLVGRGHGGSLCRHGRRRHGRRPPVRGGRCGLRRVARSGVVASPRDGRRCPGGGCPVGGNDPSALTRASGHETLRSRFLRSPFDYCR